MKYLPYEPNPDLSDNWTINCVRAHTLEATTFIPAGSHISAASAIDFWARPLIIRRDGDGSPKTE